MHASRVFSRIVDRVCDLRLGIQTRSYMSAKTLGYTSAELNDYAGLPYLELRDIFKSIPPDLKKGAFIDYGCGLGRVLVVASQKGFRRVIGVEFAESLVVAGRANLARYPTCEIVHSDAALYEVPPDATVFLFANPFYGKHLEDTLTQIATSLKASPRAHLIIGYNNARMLPEAARGAGIPLRELDVRHPRHGKVWGRWVVDY